MMFGSRDEFEYLECSNCGALSQLTPPDDLSRYYPQNYYAFTVPVASTPAPDAPMRSWISRQRNVAQLIGRPLLGSLAARCRPNPCVVDLARLFYHSRLSGPHAAILDVGCGTGWLLQRLADAGFTNLWGVDPYISDAGQRDGCPRIIRGDLSAVDGKSFELIMMHHSLEHILDQHRTFEQIRRLMAPGGTCLIRIPIAASDPWRRFRTDWVELDAPRHFVLHSCKSIALLADRWDLSVAATEFDSDSFAYWGSELYRRDTTLFDLDTWKMRDPSDFFSNEELEQFDVLARQANGEQSGGRAAFYLRHKNT
jgi:SAM-dependent methyltransferase